MRTTVMEGSLSEFDLSSVIQVVSLGRQYTGVELFDESGTVVGTLHLKSGKILDAKSGSLSGLDAVTTLLRGSRRRRFSVYRTEAASNTLRPLGSVGEVLIKLMQSEAGPPERISVMEGSLAEFDLMTVLQVISIGRQFTGVEVLEPQGTLVGRIELKSGRVVSATSGHLSGIDAIRRLLKSPRENRFVVHRTTAEVGEEHLGSLAQIMMRLADVDAGWDGTEQNTQARRPPPPVLTSVPPPIVSSVPPPVTSSIPPVTNSAPPPVMNSAPSVAPVVEAKLPPLAALPVVEVKEQGPRADAPQPFLETHTSPFGIRTLPSPAGEVPVVCVTSPKGGSGKTTVALNLAVAFARRGSRVLLVDADDDGVLLAINAKATTKAGAADVVAGKASLAEATMKTRLPGLQIVPTGDFPMDAPSTAWGWPALFKAARAQADIILVDTSAALRGPSGGACAAASHALVVVHAEPAGIRGLPAHLRRIQAMREAPPSVVGIVLNMLDYRARVSLDALADVCAGPSGSWVFDVPIARSPAFMEAVARGVPVCRGERTNSATIGWVFETLASSLLERLGIVTPTFDDLPLV